jgi:site-specific DNA recombinase
MVSDKLLRAGTLGRVSKDKSGRERSVAEQLDLNQAECDANGWQVTAKYEDAVSASRFAKKSREDWPRLLADLDAGRLDVVVLWDSSRGSREPEDWFGFLRRCREHHVLVHVTGDQRTYDVRNLRDWRTLADEGVENAYDSEKKSRDVQRGLEANAEAGLPHGRVKYGYRRVHDPRTGKLTGQEPEPAEVAVITEIIRRVAKAEPVSAIRDDLAARGLPGPISAGWHRPTVRKIALSVAYIGKRYAGGQVEGRTRTGGHLVDAAWPAIIDEPTFWAARAVLTNPARKTTKPGKAKYLLSYIMTCTECTWPCCADPPRKGRVTLRYLCHNPRCHRAQVPVSDADDLIGAAVIDTFADADVYPQLFAGNDEQAVAARSEAGRLRAELDEWVTAGVSAHAYALREAQLLPQIQQADRRADQLAVPPQFRELADPAVNTPSVWKGMHVAAKREVVRSLFSAVTLTPGPGPAQDRINVKWVTASGGPAARSRS